MARRWPGPSWRSVRHPRGTSGPPCSSEGNHVCTESSAAPGGAGDVKSQSTQPLPDTKWDVPDQGPASSPENTPWRVSQGRRASWGPLRLSPMHPAQPRAAAGSVRAPLLGKGSSC